MQMSTGELFVPNISAAYRRRMPKPAPRPPRKPFTPTPEQQADADRLLALFHKAQKDGILIDGHKVTQETLAGALGIGQSAVTQFLNAKAALPIRIALQCAAHLGGAIRDISPTMADELEKAGAGLRASFAPRDTLAADDPLVRETTVLVSGLGLQQRQLFLVIGGAIARHFPNDCEFATAKEPTTAPAPESPPAPKPHTPAARTTKGQKPKEKLGIDHGKRRAIRKREGQ